MRFFQNTFFIGKLYKTVKRIQNPDFLFDVEKPAAVDHTLTCVAQKLIDACSTSASKEKASGEVSKQIRNHDIDELQNWVRKYYQEIQTLPAQDTKDFKDFLDDENQLHQGEFNTMAAVEQLWSYVKQVFFADFFDNGLNFRRFWPESNSVKDLRIQKVMISFSITSP